MYQLRQLIVINNILSLLTSVTFTPCLQNVVKDSPLQTILQQLIQNDVSPPPPPHFLICLHACIHVIFTYVIVEVLQIHFVDHVKHHVLTLVGESTRYRNNHDFYYYSDHTVILHHLTLPLRCHSVAAGRVCLVWSETWSVSFLPCHRTSPAPGLSPHRSPPAHRWAPPLSTVHLQHIRSTGEPRDNSAHTPHCCGNWMLENLFARSQTF